MASAKSEFSQKRTYSTILKDFLFSFRCFEIHYVKKSFYLMVANWVSKFWADCGAGDIEKFGIAVPLPGVGVAGKLPPNAKAKAAPNWSCVIPGPLDPEELGWGVLKMKYYMILLNWNIGLLHENKKVI